MLHGVDMKPADFELKCSNVVINKHVTKVYQ